MGHEPNTQVLWVAGFGQVSLGRNHEAKSRVFQPGPAGLDIGNPFWFQRKPRGKNECFKGPLLYVEKHPCVGVGFA